MQGDNPYLPDKCVIQHSILLNKIQISHLLSDFLKAIYLAGTKCSGENVVQINVQKYHENTLLKNKTIKKNRQNKLENGNFCSFALKKQVIFADKVQLSGEVCPHIPRMR